MPRLNSHAAFAQKRSLPAYLPGKQFVVVVEHCRIGLPGVGCKLMVAWGGGGGRSAFHAQQCLMSSTLHRQNANTMQQPQNKNDVFFWKMMLNLECYFLCKAPKSKHNITAHSSPEQQPVSLITKAPTAADQSISRINIFKGSLGQL